MSEIVFSTVKPVYEELTSDNLLTRCIDGFTQNSNESFNSVVWSMTPKTVSSGKNILDIAANMVVCIYNDGLLSIMQSSERSLNEAVKMARLNLRFNWKEEDEEYINIEDQLYGASITD
ncbi:hypothetical protein ANTQUA_LOCUS8225 [Anthophora quadrimaculata]